MTDQYRKIFINSCRIAAKISEEAADYNKTKGDEKSVQVDLTMRDNYNKVHDKLRDNQPLEKKDIMLLYFICTLSVKQFETYIKNYTTTIKQYNEMLIPNLKKAMDAPNVEEEFEKLFTINI